MYNCGMKVLFAVWELSPFIKVGGLGDVARTLPKALHDLGVDIRVVIPYYRAVRTGGQRRVFVTKLIVTYGGRRVQIKVWKIKFLDADIPVYLLENRKYLSVPGKETWGVYDLAIAEMVKWGVDDWKPEIVHSNDNHCGFIPLICKEWKLPVKHLFTIHALLHQRRVPERQVEKMGLDLKKCHVMRWETKNKRVVSLLEGVVYADLVNTVSQTYAREILTEEYGAGLDDILRTQHPGKIFGILNGIDYNFNDPRINKLAKNYDAENVTEGKKINKSYLQKKLGFKQDAKMPLIGFVGRLDQHQKGIDLIHKMLLRIDLKKWQFVILGEGQVEWEEKFKLLASFYPKNIAYLDKYTDELAIRLYAGTDLVLIPSRFEPCCLVQMIAMKYGAIPVARATGGLLDTIKDEMNGFLFEKASSHELEKTLKKANDMRVKYPGKFTEMVKEAMNRDFSWKKSAQQYLEVYKKLVQ